jgi:ABC-type transport system involved in multi-copper enzyme maturation permease subunit
MFRALSIRSLRDSLTLLASCCALMFGFVWLRLWIVSQIDFQEAIGMFAKVIPPFIQKMLPVPIEVIATIEGRITFSYEELPVGLLIALWTVTRGSECLAGRLGDGTMEMLLSQPVRRLTLVTSHVSVTLFGLGLISLAAWLATAVGIATIDFDEPTSAQIYLPALANLLSVGVFMAGAATLASALARSRTHAVALFVAFYVVEITCKILGLLASKMAWLKKLSFLAAYEPTQLTVGLQQDPTATWPLFWQYNGLLIGLGMVALAIAATIFCHRDVPAPL